jgi:simple sugar transport system ATP-binding protein
VLILDEPTAVLTPSETEDLFRIMRELRASGKAIVFISHKLNEVRAIADTVTILRRGQVVGQRPPSTSGDELAALMVGRNVQLRVSKAPSTPGRIVLDVKDLMVPSGQTVLLPGEEPVPAVKGLTFRVRAGEILGIAGVQGNGQTELCEALMGLVPIISGSVQLNDRDVTGASPQARLRGGIGYIPEDRQQDGLVSSFPVSENIVLDTYDRRPFASGLALNLTAIRETAEKRVKEYDIRTQSITTPVGTLSGGNQQKVILAREVGREVSLLLASQPTRGLDVGSIEFVHKRIIQERDRGAAVILVSSELDEIYALSDRIAVMYEGRFTGFRPPDVPVEELGLLMAGIDGVGTPEAPGLNTDPVPAPETSSTAAETTDAPPDSPGTPAEPPEAEAK